MKKKNISKLALDKSVISNLQANSISGGGTQDCRAQGSGNPGCVISVVVSAAVCTTTTTIDTPTNEKE